MSAGLYIHIPFCAGKCSYCSFNSIPAKKNSPLIKEYFEALALEIGRSAGGEAASVYFGGGTPSFAGAELLAKTLLAVRKKYSVPPETEITVEVNPGTAGTEFFRKIKDAGVNRISLGMQSSDNATLKYLGRFHNNSETESCLREARAAGIENIGLDLIFGIPGQSLRDIEREAEKLLSLAPEHISTYCLSIDEGTGMYRRKEKGELLELSGDLAADMYYLLKDRLSVKYSHYELSNYSLPGRESKHNQIYWNYNDYLGFGAGAASKCGPRRMSNESDLLKYIELIKRNDSAILFEENLTEETQLKETVFLGLRLLRGINLAGWKTRFGKDFLFLFEKQVEKLAGLGLIEQEDGYVKLTREGLFVSNEVFVEFV